MLRFLSFLFAWFKVMFNKQRAARFGFNTHGNIIPVPNPGGRNITLIAAHDSLGGIGHENDIPWMLKADMRHFKRLTINHVNIMGRKTWDSLPVKPLRHRINIVITRDVAAFYEKLSQDQINETIAFASLEEAIESVGQQQIFIIGGGQIYQEAMRFADDLIITTVEDVFITDTKFPRIIKQQFLEPIFSRHQEGMATFRYTYWRRIKNE